MILYDFLKFRPHSAGKGMNTARCRLREKGLTFTFKADSEKNLMHITRIS